MYNTGEYHRKQKMGGLTMNRIRNKELENFFFNVAWLRRKHGLSKKQMSNMLKIGVKTLTLLEHGTLPPRLSSEIFFRIQACFGLSPVEQLTKRMEE